MRVREILYEMPMAEYINSTEQAIEKFREYGYDLRFGFSHVKDRAVVGSRGEQMDGLMFRSTFMSLLGNILRGKFDDVWEEARTRTSPSSRVSSRDERSVSVVIRHLFAKPGQDPVMVNVPCAFFYYGKVPTIKVLTVMVKNDFHPRPTDIVIEV